MQVDRPGQAGGLLAEMCAEVRERLVPLAAEIADAIVAATPHYAAGLPTQTDLQVTVREFAGAELEAIAAGRGAVAAELAAAREHGARRARQGTAVEDVITGFYVGYRALWRELVALAQGPAGAEALLVGAETSMAWMLEITTALSTGHHDARVGRDALLAGGRLRLLNLASGTGQGTGGGDARELRSAAEQAGFDPGGEFQAWVAPAAEGPGEPPKLREGMVARVQARLDLLPGMYAVGQEPGAVLILVQGGDPDRVAGALGEQGLACVAAGLARTGHYAARESLQDARAAAALARGRAGRWAFAALWPMALADESGERLEPLIGPLAAVARSHPHLAEAVRAFADHGFTVSSAARTLSVHPNTLSYRLERWQELTGAGVRTVAGLVASRTAVELVGGDAQDDRRRLEDDDTVSPKSRNPTA
ncbi:helix-turn-helix domain-containing protein [Streptomyces mirabilis]|uniref:helix-turn-helix domain-containing protein n=1 Tax=Streptomyces mirabilis TaxID=68239 RepID=UPI003648EA6A